MDIRPRQERTVVKVNSGVKNLKPLLDQKTTDPTCKVSIYEDEEHLVFMLLNEGLPSGLSSVAFTLHQSIEDVFTRKVQQYKKKASAMTFSNKDVVCSLQVCRGRPQAGNGQDMEYQASPQSDNLNGETPATLRD
ncbi:hypothetical protein AXG93_3105s1220 [Marchantia polymorpha subsp. ruderalis]|uniref:Uncharacterized protein n=1 Tax=Marchantia polymorpha subsp. ruderalis TaxID=1480154 RepID=A0A176WLF9_MARPO|nr:hypothetical protein AXG93_3105s1220 [Marchantia polymorpha subsp. ruderalis]